MLYCTFSILIKDVILIKFSKESNVEAIWFQFLYQLNEIDPFETHEILFILNFLLNLTTNGEYYTRIENKLFCNYVAKSCASIQSFQNFNKFSFTSFKMASHPNPDNESFHTNDAFLLNRIDHYDRNKELSLIFEQYIVKFSTKTQKFKINTVWFLDVLLRVLFEIVSEFEIKKLYLYILHDFIKLSNYNLAFLANDAISVKLLIYFRYEEDDKIRKIMSAILLDILKENSKVSHIRILTSILKFPFEFSEIIKSLIPVPFVIVMSLLCVVLSAVLLQKMFIFYFNISVMISG